MLRCQENPCWNQDPELRPWGNSGSCATAGSCCRLHGSLHISRQWCALLQALHSRDTQDISVWPRTYSAGWPTYGSSQDWACTRRCGFTMTFFSTSCEGTTSQLPVDELPCLLCYLYHNLNLLCLNEWNEIDCNWIVFSRLWCLFYDTMS